MRALLLIAACTCGCRFGVQPVDAGVETPAPDLSTDDLSTGAPDLTGVDLLDPCSVVPPTVPGALVATCAAGAPPVIDGRLDDWQPSPFVNNAIRHATAAGTFGMFTGNETANDLNISGVVGMQWDESYLYVAATITDDIRDVSSTTLYLDDAIELYLDGAGDHSDAYEADDAQLIFAATGIGQMYKFGALPGPAMVPGGVLVKTRDTGAAAGWTFEAAIPWSAIGVSAASAGRLIGFDVALDDSDGPSKRSLVWKNDSPSGCMCNGMGCLPYCAPKAFTTVQLGSR